MPPKKKSGRSSRRNKEPEEENEEVETNEEETTAEEEENTPIEEEEEEEAMNEEAESENRPVEEEEKMDIPDESKETSEPIQETPAPPVEEKTIEDEPPAKKPKVEEAIRKIQAEVERKEKEALEKEEQAKADKRKELDKFWKTVKDDPSDFTGWTYLLQFVDNKNELDTGREAYNAFLKRYPYCYGYWKKHGDFEKRNGTRETTMAVFDRGLAAIPLSADLWIHFLNYMKSIESETPQIVRDSYERAVNACGREWRSDKLWDHYVKWEHENKDLPRIFQMYQKILRNPTQGLSQQLETFKKFVNENNPKDLMDTSEFLQLRKEVLATLKGSEDENGEKSGEEAAAPGTDSEAAMSSDEETVAIREKIISGAKKVYKETEERVNLRWKFEEGIKRPYFHVKPLERGQLKNWHEYINFMKEEMSKEGGDLSEVEILYERCLIACALYEEFWMNYTTWWESREGDNTAKIREIFTRACTSHLPTKVDIHARWAAFEETQGDYAAAATILETLETAHPELVSLLLRRVNLERRRGNNEKACSLYEAAINAAKDQSSSSDLAIKYSRYLRLHQSDEAKSASVLAKALESDPTNPKLYLQQLDSLLHRAPLDVAEVVKLLDDALKQELADKHKFLFSQRKVEFLEDFGTDISSLQKAQKDHVEMTKKTKEALKATEKTADEPGKNISTIEGRTGKKDDKTNGTASYPPVGSGGSGGYTAQQQQAFSNYGQRYSGYPTAPPAAAQTGGNSYQGYGQYYQGYGGYGGSGY